MNDAQAAELNRIAVKQLIQPPSLNEWNLPEEEVEQIARSVWLEEQDEAADARKIERLGYEIP